MKTIPQSGTTLQILRGINLEIHQGESVAITGMSGSGKSTLLGLLAGLDLPTSGTVELFGQTLTGLDEDQRAALRLGRVGFVFQAFHLLEHLTALENVMLPLELGNSRPTLEMQARQALQRVGLGERLTHFPPQLSGGEQQRVALARAFVTRPTILFADEPTGSLDGQTASAILELLLSIQQEQRVTLVVVTHDHQVAQLMHRQVMVHGGRVEEVRKCEL